MKKFHSFLLIFCFLGFHALAQETHLKKIDPGFDGAKKALLFFKSDTIALDCDSVYLMNKATYAFFMLIYQNLFSNDLDLVCSNLLQSYEERLQQSHETYQKLLANCKETEKVSFDMMNDTRKSLESTQKTLDYTQLTLDQTLQTLESANKYMKKERSKSIFEKVLLGVGGLGIGLVIGVLIAN